MMTRTSHALSRDRALRDRHARCRRRPPGLLGARPAPRAPSRPSSCMAGRAAASRRSTAAVRSEALRRDPVRPARLRQVDARMPGWRPTRPGISSPTSSGCARCAGFDKWLVFGGSWGSTLALAYAETHPERVSELVVRGIYTLTRPELDWYYQFGVSRDVSGQVGALPRADPRGRARRHDGRLPQAADRHRPQGAGRGAPAPGACGKARRSRCCRSPRPAASSARTISPSPSPASRTIISSMPAGWRKGSCCAMPAKLKDIPGVIVHGRYDMPCPAKYAWALHKAWPEAEFHLIEGAGHALFRARHSRPADPRDGQVCGKVMRSAYVTPLCPAGHLPHKGEIGGARLSPMSSIDESDARSCQSPP